MKQKPRLLLYYKSHSFSISLSSAFLSGARTLCRRLDNRERDQNACLKSEKKKDGVAAAPLLTLFFSGKHNESSFVLLLLLLLLLLRVFDSFDFFSFFVVVCFVWNSTSFHTRLPVYYYCEKKNNNKKKKKNGVVPNKVHQNRIVWTGETRHGAFTVLDLSLSLSFFFSLSCARVFLFFFFFAGKKSYPVWWDLFCLFLSVSLSLTFLYARIPLDASLTLFLSLLFSSIDRLERSWSPSG